MTSLPAEIKIDTSLFDSIADLDHKWGGELRFVNEPLYCGKFLILTNNELSSLHMHKNKTETFVVLAGSVQLTVLSQGIMRLNPGDKFTIYPDQLHQFKADGKSLDAVILEVSTHHEDSDTYRTG